MPARITRALLMPLVAVFLAVFVAAPARADSPASALFQTYLGSGHIGEAEEKMVALAGRASGNADAQLGLGLIRTGLAIEHLMQSLYKYGFATDLPAARLLGLSSVQFSTNPNPRPITYEQFRGIITTFVADLESADKAFADVGDRPAKLTVDLAVTHFDWNGDGVIDERDHIGAAFADIDENGKPRPFIVAFDTADAKWFRGYCNLLLAVSKTLLSHDMSKSWNTGFAGLFPKAVSSLGQADGGNPSDQTLFDLSKRDTDAIADLVGFVHTVNWPVSDKAMWLEVRAHLKTVIRLNHETWALIAQEKDDDHEWLPGPQQKSGVLPSFNVTKERIQSWLAVLDQVDLALDGKLLVPHWRFVRGINLAKVFEEPRDLDIVLWFTGPAALPYLDDGKVLDRQNWSQATSIFEGDFTRYAFYFN